MAQKTQKRLFFLPHPHLHLRNRFDRIVYFAKRYPIRTFLTALVLLFLLIIVGSLITPQKKEAPQPVVTKSVTTYAIGSLPQVTTQAKVRKTGIVTIAAQTAGVVQTISVTEGDSVLKGQQIITLSTNYQGGNAPAIQTQIANAQAQNLTNTYQTQLGIIQDQKDIATASAAVAQKTRDITGQTIGQTQNALNSDNSIIDNLNKMLDSLNATNQQGANQTQITQTEQQLAQLESGTSQLQQSLSTAQYQSDNNNPPALISNLQQDLTLKQLDVQKQTLDLSKNVAGLQANLAAVNESLMYPATPIDGTVQKVSVRIGQLVNPGTPLVTVAGSSDDPVTAVVSVPQDVAKNIAVSVPSTLTIGNQKVLITPSFVSTDATDGQAYAVYYQIPSEYQDQVTDGQYLTIAIPIGEGTTNTETPYVPIDAIYQTQTSAYLYVLENEKAQSRTVTLGTVYGDYVEVLSGLHPGDQVIETRNVIDGDKVAMQL